MILSHTLGALKRPFEKIISSRDKQSSPRNSPTSTNAHAHQQPAEKRRKIFDPIRDCLQSVMSSQSNGTIVAIPPTPPLEWQPVPTDAHNDRARAYLQTQVLTRGKTRHTFVCSSRGFGRELPPTQKTRPALRQRRHSIDVLTIGYKEGDRAGWAPDEPSGVLPLAPVISGPVPPLRSGKPSRETDEPSRRIPYLPFPEARRYFEFDRPYYYYFPEWSNETYLELPNSSLSKEDFRTIVEANSIHGWFRDQVLDVALERLAMKMNCEQRSIAIANSMTAQLFYWPGKFGDMDDNNYTGFTEYKKMFENKDFIFLPINDGFVATDNNDAHGAHWSLLAINRVNKAAHYVDSYFVEVRDYQELAYTIKTGLERILGEKYEFFIEHETPDQWRYNAFDGHDSGPCGPFVVVMIELYIKAIMAHQDLGRTANLHIPWGYKFRFKKYFNSWDVRVGIAEDLARARVRQISERLLAAHDAAALAGMDGEFEIIGAPDPLPRLPRAETPEVVVEDVDEPDDIDDIDYILNHMEDGNIASPVRPAHDQHGQQRPQESMNSDQDEWLDKMVIDLVDDEEGEAVDIPLSTPPESAEELDVTVHSQENNDRDSF